MMITTSRKELDDAGHEPGLHLRAGVGGAGGPAGVADKPGCHLDLRNNLKIRNTFVLLVNHMPHQVGHT